MRLFHALRAAAPNLGEIQGDLFSRGFPKFNETYYFFSIRKPADFSKALPKLVDGKHISSLATVLAQWKGLDGPADAKAKEKKVVSLSNALIAFSISGLREVCSAVHAWIAVNWIANWQQHGRSNVARSPSA